MSACREQELKIQSIKASSKLESASFLLTRAQSTIEHRLFTDIPSMMHRIAETDDLADVRLCVMSLDLADHLAESDGVTAGSDGRSDPPAARKTRCDHCGR